ncbi:MAG: hypothetical protein PHN60_04170 [Candidatus Gracilibacteria bacterium]|nr:hypothetical protein [Candidatus Gracilibacteria bacterium]
MPENKSLPPISNVVSKDTALSPTIAAIVEKAHLGATEIIERFAANERNPIRYYLREANATIACILGKQTKPEYFSQIIALKKQFREQEAANDADFQEQKAA